MFIKGIPSGDGECWCLLVTKKTFRDLTGRIPDDESDRHAGFGAYRYKIYPHALFDLEYKQRGDIYLFNVEAVKVSDLT